jgi:tRNA A37 threonylcarbamoyladenosine modification protein TsaB
LEAVALASGAEGRVAAAIDAQRTEVFVGEYLIHSASLEAESTSREALSSFGEFTASLAAAALAAASPQVFTPDAGLATRLHEAGFQAELLTRPSAEDFAHIAYCRFLGGMRADVSTLDAHYLRRSDAEILVASKPVAIETAVTNPDRTF